MIASRRRHSSDGGFTLIESLTASAILLVVAVGVITTLITTAGWYAKARLRTEAYAIANQVMATIQSRNYSDINIDTSGKTYPTGIPASMSWPATGTAEFTVLTSMETSTDPKTQLEMKKIAVSVVPISQSLDPTVTVTRYASGWQEMSTSTQGYLVPVKVQLNPFHSTDGVGAGARVQLLDPDTLDESYGVVADDTGLATFTNVLEGQYYLTLNTFDLDLSGWYQSTDYRPVYCPIRIAPTHGGTANNPILSVNSYALSFTKSEYSAILRVGAYTGDGWTVVDGSPVSPGTSAKYVSGLTVYARQVLNSGTDSEYYGLGSGLLYPDETKLPVYSAQVNGYGVAVIHIPWTTNPNASQYWEVWCSTKTADGKVTVQKFTTTASGDWASDLQDWQKKIQRPDGADLDGTSYSSIVQFSQLGENVTAYNDPTVPSF